MKSTESISDNFLHINSCGYENLYGCDAGSIRPNGRCDYHIIYVAEGACFVTLEGKTVQAPAGSVIVYLPFQRQEYRFDKDIRTRSYYIHFSGTGCAELTSRFKMADENIFHIGYSRNLEGLFNILIDEFRLKCEYYDENCQGVLLSILSLIGRKIAESASQLQISTRKLIKEVCRDIYTNYSNEISVKSLAKQCNLSESRFSHIFREVVGISPKQYILNAKIEIAKEQLKNTDFSILQISNMAGFREQNYFSRAFKKYVGVSPTQFRKNQ